MGSNAFFYRFFFAFFCTIIGAYQKSHYLCTAQIDNTHIVHYTTNYLMNSHILFQSEESFFEHIMIARSADRQFCCN